MKQKNKLNFRRIEGEDKQKYSLYCKSGKKVEASDKELQDTKQFY